MVFLPLVTLATVALAATGYGADAACATAPFGKCGSNADGVSCCPDNQYCQPWDAGFFQCIAPPDKCKQQLTNVDLYGNDIKTVYGIQPGNCCDECTKTPGCVAYTFVNSNPGQPACYLKSAMGESRTSVGAVSGIVNNTPTPSPSPTVTPTPSPSPTPTPTPTSTPGPGPAQCSQQLADVDLYGNDIKTITGVQNSECCAQCAQTAGCVAYTFTNNNGQTACYLKNGMGERRALPGAVSGVLNTSTPTPNPGCSTALYGSCGSSSGTTCCPSGSYCQPWNPTFYQCVAVPPRCTQQLTDMDYYGNDIKTVYVSLPTLCCDECANTPGCKAYTYINSNPGQPVCYLKSAAGTPTRSVGAVSGRLN